MNTFLTDVDANAIGRSPTYQPIGLAALLRAATAGNDLTSLGQRLLEYTDRHDDPYALLDLSIVLELKYQRPSALAVQALAVQMQRHYCIKRGRSVQTPVKLLVLKAPGDLMANTPFECLLNNADLQIDVLYVDEHMPADAELPEHDVVLVAACASDQNVATLRRIEQLTRRTGCPVLNRVDGILHTTRDAAYALLGNVHGICMAHTVRLPRSKLVEAAHGIFELSEVVRGCYPFIIRPVGSHAGKGLARITDRHELARYLEDTDVQEYFIAPFIDYRHQDGLFRKYRIVMIDGRPFLCHMGISTEWIVHYPYGEMVEHPERREEEARLMASFDSDFAVRHRDALRMVPELTGLDYVGFDCAETHDGRLLIFEIATAMVVHDMDDPVTFPYKLPQMRRVFDAFHRMLCRAVAQPRPM